jgi:pyruvate ferredoxin oxidoreductase gamma subunit
MRVLSSTPGSGLKLEKIRTFIRIEAMLESFSIRWHSRAGQGAVTASDFVGNALGQMGYATLSFPNFGAEKRGAPVEVFNRVSKNEKTENPAQPTHPDLVILLDPSLVGAELSYADIVRGLKPDGKFVINTGQKEKTKFSEIFSGKIYHVPATKIALETIQRDVPNVAMVGALTKILDLDFEKIAGFLKEDLSKVFPAPIVEKNLEGFDRGYNEVTLIS